MNTYSMLRAGPYRSANFDLEKIWLIIENTSYPLLRNLCMDDHLVMDYNDRTPSNATTGDPFTFDVSIPDPGNGWMLGVEYWLGSREHRFGRMEYNGSFRYTMTIPGDFIGTQKYIIHIVSPTQVYYGTDLRSTEVLDNDPPLFGPDNTPSIAYSGEPMNYAVVVFDNIGIGSLTLDYWYGSLPHQERNMSLSHGDEYRYMTVAPDDFTGLVNYSFIAIDHAGNEAMLNGSIRVIDTIAPVLYNDLTPARGTTGDPFVFEADIRDNIDLDQASVEYWYWQGEHHNESMVENGTFSRNITLPADSIASFTYRFHFADKAGIWVHTPERSVSVVDDDAPIFQKDTTRQTGTTGDDLLFQVEVRDNIGLTSVLLEYWLYSDERNNVTMNGSGPFFFILVSPDDRIGQLSYVFHAFDERLNHAISSMGSVNISDDDRPVFTGDLTPLTGDTGGMFGFKVKVLDNIGIDTVSIEYSIGEETQREVQMTGSGDIYSLSVGLALDRTDPIRYRFIANDTSGNLNQTERRTVIVQDRIPPVVTRIDDVTVYETQRIDIAVPASDNIGISNYEWNGAPLEPEGNRIEGTANKAGVYRILVKVFDLSGNEARVQFNLTVLSRFHDRDGDKMADLWEVDNDLDPDDPYDADLDNDNDGMTNLEEYLSGTDPNIFDPAEEHGSKRFPFAALLIVPIIIAITGASIFFFRRRNRWKAAPSYSDVYE